MSTEPPETNDFTEAQAGLTLLSSEEADAFIGSPQPTEYTVLIRATRAVFRMFYNLVARTEQVNLLEAVSKTMVMALTLVHTAYAAGIKEGGTRVGSPELVALSSDLAATINARLKQVTGKDARIRDVAAVRVELKRRLRTALDLELERYRKEHGL
jgi:hypothetical protein